VLLVSLAAATTPAETFFTAYARASNAGDDAAVLALYRSDVAITRPEAPPLAGRDAATAELARVRAVGCHHEVSLGMGIRADGLFVEERILCPPKDDNPYLGTATAYLTRFDLDGDGKARAVKSWIGPMAFDPVPGASASAPRFEGAAGDRADRITHVRELHAGDHAPPIATEETAWATPDYVVTVGDRWLPDGKTRPDIAEVSVFRADGSLVERRRYVPGAMLKWQPLSGAPRP
jgi:hypothetical protein